MAAHPAAGNDTTIFHLALVTKVYCDALGPFGLAIVRGCQDGAAASGRARCDCVVQPPEGDNESAAAVSHGAVLTNLTRGGRYDGILLHVKSPAIDVAEPIAAAARAGIPVVTVASDAGNTARLAYVGTDNAAMGRQMGKVLRQLRPRGGTYALVSGNGPGLLQRMAGLREALAGTDGAAAAAAIWTELPESPLLLHDRAQELFNGTAGEEIDRFLRRHRPDALLPLYGNPMRDPDEWRALAARHRGTNVTFVGAEMGAHQIELLSQGHVHGLVGQLPYDMGRRAAGVLLRALGGATTTATAEEVIPSTGILATNMVEIVRVPLDLPPLDFDHGYLGSLRVLGHVAFAIVALLSIGSAAWTFRNRQKYVVRASQPVFLYLISLGVLLLGSWIVAMGIDDERYSRAQCSAACMVSPWLVSLGFALIFSALYSKTRRVNQIFRGARRFRRLTVQTKDVILPLVFMLGANTIVLVCWTATNPVRYVRIEGRTTDLWNRVNASVGMCEKRLDQLGRSSIACLVLLGLINVGALVIALVEAYKARDIETEFAESRYIALVFASMTQAILLGAPMLALVSDDARATYVLGTVFVFLLCVAILSLMFLPKYLSQRRQDTARGRRRSGVRISGVEVGGTTSSMHGSSLADDSLGLKMQVWTKVRHEYATEPSNNNETTETLAPVILKSTKFLDADSQYEPKDVSSAGLAYCAAPNESLSLASDKNPSPAALPKAKRLGKESEKESNDRSSVGLVEGDELCTSPSESPAVATDAAQRQSESLDGIELATTRPPTQRSSTVTPSIGAHNPDQKIYE